MSGNPDRSVEDVVVGIVDARFFVYGVDGNCLVGDDVVIFLRDFDSPPLVVVVVNNIAL